MAEAVRAYLTDPNYLKTVAPGAAARIRAAWNSNPQLARIMHFNDIAPLALMGLGGLGLLGSRPDTSSK
jgi:hypothetical protein